MRGLLLSTRHALSARRPPEGIVTRLAPSQHVPGCQGVYLTADVKKFTPIEIHASASQPAASTAMTPASVTASVSPSPPSPVPAPPFVCNLALAPRRTISLRRFLALRHSFSHDTFLNVATEGGWYLLVPSSAVPLPDPEGLARWQGRHHHRYQPAANEAEAAEKAARSKRAQHVAFRKRAYAKLAEMNAEELSEEELLALGKAIADEEAAVAAKDEEDGASIEHSHSDVQEAEEEPEADGVGANDEDGPEPVSDTDAMTSATRAASSPTSSPRTHRYRNRHAPLYPPLIPEAHLFQLNDAIFWPLPPTEDVTDPSYWAQHKLRMRLYQDTNSIRPEDHEQFLADALEGRLRTPPEEASEADKATFQETHAVRAPDPSKETTLTQQEVYAISESLYRAATRKANAAVNVDDETGLVTIVPLMDLEEGTELVLHYGREWWLQRLLSMVLLAVPDAAMHKIRWIEGVCSGSGGHTMNSEEADIEAEMDETEPFPQLILARREPRQRRRHRKQSRPDARPASAASAATPEESELVADACDSASGAVASATAKIPTDKRVLFNMATRDRATDAQVLAFAVRRSCLDRDFYSALLFWRGARRRRSTREVLTPPQEAVFSLEKPDEEVPLSRLRQALVWSLESARCASDADLEDVLEGVASHSRTDDDETAENKEETFSV